jgi:hypothetical protein
VLNWSAGKQTVVKACNVFVLGGGGYVNQFPPSTAATDTLFAFTIGRFPVAQFGQILNAKLRACNLTWVFACEDHGQMVNMLDRTSPSITS